MASLRKGEKTSEARIIGARGDGVEPSLMQPGGACRLPPELRKPAGGYWRRHCMRRTLSEEKGAFDARDMNDTDREETSAFGVAIYLSHFYK